MKDSTRKLIAGFKAARAYCPQTRRQRAAMLRAIRAEYGSPPVRTVYKNIAPKVSRA